MQLAEIKRLAQQPKLTELYQPKLIVCPDPERVADRSAAWIIAEVNAAISDTGCNIYPHIYYSVI